MCVFFVIVLPIHENGEILSTFIMHPDCAGGLGAPPGPPGGPSGALRRHQIVDISLALQAYWHIGTFMFFVIFVQSLHAFPEN